MAEQVNLIEETSDSYIVDDGGKRKTLYKIDQKEVNRMHRSSIKKVATSLDGEDLEQFINVVSDVLNNIPNVLEYENIAINVSKYLKLLYDKIGSPNILWHPIKNIDPTIYGKAQTLINELMDLFHIIYEVAKQMEKDGKIQEFKTNLEVDTEDSIHKTLTLPEYIEINFSIVK